MYFGLQFLRVRDNNDRDGMTTNDGHDNRHRQPRADIINGNEKQRTKWKEARLSRPRPARSDALPSARLHTRSSTDIPHSDLHTAPLPACPLQVGTPGFQHEPPLSSLSILVTPPLAREPRFLLPALSFIKTPGPPPFRQVLYPRT